jgi:hypothetical protein
MTLCYVWTFAGLVKEQEKQMNLEYKDYCVDEFRRPLASRLLDCALTAFLFSTSVFGMCVGALWAFGYIEIWMPPQW